jgi:hypothetical protein
LDEVRQAFVDKALEASMHAAIIGAAGAALAKATPYRPPGQDAKAKRAAADKRKAAAAAAADGIKPGDGTKPPTKE